MHYAPEITVIFYNLWELSPQPTWCWFPGTQNSGQKQKKALPLLSPATRAGQFWENWPRFGLANKYCICGIILRSATVPKTQPDKTWQILVFLYGLLFHFRCSVREILLYLQFYRKNINNLGTRFCNAFECSTYKCPALPTTLFLKALNLKAFSCHWWAIYCKILCNCLPWWKVCFFNKIPFVKVVLRIEHNCRHIWHQVWSLSIWFLTLRHQTIHNIA